MRWILIAMCIFGFALCFVTKSAGVLGLGILLGMIGLFGTVFSIASDRVSATARPDSAILDPETVAKLRERAARPPQPPNRPAPRVASTNEPPRGA